MKRIIATILGGAALFAGIVAYATESLNTKYDSGDDAAYTWDGSTVWAQTFTPSTTGSFPYFDIFIYNSGCTGSVTLAVRTTTGSVPNSSASNISTATVACSSLTSGTPAWQRFTFSSPASLTSGTLYAMVLTGNTPVVWRGDSTSPSYADGRLCYDNAAPADGEAGWACLTTDEFMFRTYVTDAAPADTQTVLYGADLESGVTIYGF